PSPQPRALDTTFEARVRDYMAAHTERMERFKNTIFKQREEINGRMTEMFGLLKELTTSKTPEKVLIREEAKFPVTKNVNYISLVRNEEEENNKTYLIPDNAEKSTETKTETPVTEVEEINEVENGAVTKSFKTSEGEEAVEAPAGKKKGKEYKILPGGPAYDAILKKMITKKEDIKGNFKIPCNIGGLKHVHALVDQGYDVNVMPYSTYMKLTDERPAETNIRLSLASHSYIYPLGIAKDALVEVAEHIYPADFVIMDIKENEKRPFILGMPFLTTAKASIKFDTGTITLRSGKSKISFSRIPEPLSHVKNGIKNDIKPIAPTMTVNRLVLEWEEKIRLHQEKEMLYLMRRSLEVRRKFHWMILKGRFNQLSHVSSPLLSKLGEYVKIGIDEEQVPNEFYGRTHILILYIGPSHKAEEYFLSQDKYVAEILEKFDFMSMKTASTPIKTHKPLVKDEEAADVDVHLYRFQVTPKTSHLHAVKRIFRYLKGKPKLGLWYPKETSFDLVAYSDSDYGGANLDRKSTTGGCQFLGHRLISWQCKKQTIVATSTTEAEYVAAANCCG
ncbi:MAK10-like protein, partial [Tanacetum coccineum]